MPRKQSASNIKAEPSAAGLDRKRRSSSAKPRARSARQLREAADTVSGSLDGARLDALVRGQREILSLVAGHEALETIAARLDQFFRQLLDADRCTFVLADREDGRDCIVLTPSAPAPRRRSSGLRPALIEQVATAVSGWETPLLIESERSDRKWADLRALLGRRRKATGWALPILGQSSDRLGFVLLRVTADRRPDAGARQMLGLLQPLVSVAIASTRREQAAKAADERFASLAATIPGVVYQRLVSPDGDIRYRYISEGARELFGVEPEKILADPQALFEHYAPSYRKTFRRRLLEASKALRLWDVEAQIVTPDGTEKWTHAIARPHPQPDGSVLWNGVILDATRIKQAELELRGAKEAAEEASRLQSELLEKLQSADERLSSLAATIPGVVYQRLVTPDGKIRYTYISEGARDLFGVEPEEVLSDPNALFRRHGPEYRKTFRERLLAASKSMTLWDVEAQIVTPDGQKKWTHAIARPHRRDDGSVLWNGVILDATRIKEAELAAAAAEGRTRAAIVESISQGIAIFDASDRLVTSNSQLLNMFPGLKGKIEPGTGYETVLRAEAEGCVEPDGSAPGRQMLRDWLSRHDEPESSVERRLADGRWILINERRTEAGTIVLYTDVTDLKRREEQLHLAKTRAELANVELEKTVRRLDIALENMTQGLCLFDSRLRSILCNRRYAKIFRLPADLTAPGVPIHDQASYVAKQGNASEADTIALVDDRLSYAASRARCTYRLTLPDKRQIEVIHQPLPDGGAVETFTEVAGRPRRRTAGAAEKRPGSAAPGQEQAPGSGALEDRAALARARDEARSADRGKAEFLSALGQALKKSLGTIIDPAEAMAGAVYGPLGDERYQQFARTIREEGASLLALVKDIDAYSRLSAGELELSERRVDLGKLLESCVSLARHRAQNDPPAISIAEPATGYEVNADETKLMQAFLNLLSNAVRFTPAGGRIEVSIAPVEDGGLDVAITDAGAGVAAKTVSSLLRPAASVNGAAVRAPCGPDLGLPVVRSLIEQHGGRLTLAGAKGRGTTATVHLPGFRVVGRPPASAR